MKMSFLNTLVNNFQDSLERNRNRPFLKATMAACALVATADGVVSLGERVRVDQILETLEALKIFDPHEAVDLFNDFSDAILESPHTGHDKALAALADAAKDQETKTLIIRICCAISEVSHDVGKDTIAADQIEIVSLCSRLGVDPKTCDLYVE
ncbi:MAG: tellurite resistance TerB family protein [Rhodospirillaceae bacterium]|nr:tellurite resistance TerB family protein [Rhodospirillaceae bacterium]